MLSTAKNALRTMLVMTCLALAACQPAPAPAKLAAADASAAEPIAATATSAAEPIAATATSAAEPITATSDGASIKVAFIGDSNYRANFKRVLTLIKNEGADLVLHQGDFDYKNDADGFFAVIDAILGPNFPYLASVGNHDIGSWRADCGDSDGCYAQLLKDRMARIGIVPDDPDLNDQMYSVAYRGLKMVFVGDQRRAGDVTYAPYIDSQFAADPQTWRICSWHRNQHIMQVGTKGDETGWAVYETCRNHGAIIATGHEHSYSRTKTLSHMQSLTVDTHQHPPIDGVPSNPDQLLVGPGRSFVFVSGLGGSTMRNQDRCAPFSYPYGGGPGCNYMWASVYTSDQAGGAEKFGALFILFNYQGDPTKAHGYFKTSDGEIIDEFDITAAGASVSIAKPNTE